MALPNAVAGPSHVGPAHSTSQSDPSSSTVSGAGLSILAAYLAPDPEPPRPRSIIHPTHDLLGRYGILPVYDEFVRPFTTAPSSIEDKGKRKEDAPASAMPVAQDGADDTRSGPKEGLFQHGYKHFIKDLGLGKHNHKKDTFLTDLMLNPEKQVMPIVKLDRNTLVHAFRLKEGGVPGFNSSALTGDDEKRKKKKKKRPIDPTQTSAPASQHHTPAPPVTNPPTPSSSTPAPVRRPPPPPSQLANGHVPPQSSQLPQPTQRPPPQPQRHPLPAIPKAASAAARPPGAGTGTGGTGSIKRKDREDAGANGHAPANGSGNGGIGPGANGLKPAKKRKMDPMAFAHLHQHQHQVVQQPTPHY